MEIDFVHFREDFEIPFWNFGCGSFTSKNALLSLFIFTGPVDLAKNQSLYFSSKIDIDKKVSARFQNSTFPSCVLVPRGLKIVSYPYVYFEAKELL